MAKGAPSVGRAPQRFLDIETGGLDPSVHDILEIAILDSDGAVLLHRRIHAENIEAADPKALEKNHYDQSLWDATARTWAETAPIVADHLRHSVILGWGLHFDIRFLATKGLDAYALGSRVVDIMPLAYEHLGQSGMVSGLKLERTCAFLDISNERAHTAEADARRAMLVWQKLQRVSALRRLWWRARAAVRQPRGPHAKAGEYAPDCQMSGGLASTSGKGAD